MVYEAMWSKKYIIVGLLVLVAMAVALSAALLYGEKGFLYYIGLKHQKEGFIQSNGEWREKNHRLYEHIERLRHDPAYIEKMARKELGLVKEGELVYIFEPVAPATPP
jgi:cell division protein FtsB